MAGNFVKINDDDNLVWYFSDDEIVRIIEYLDSYDARYSGEYDDGLNGDDDVDGGGGDG